jgi:hypothetical protein
MIDIHLPDADALFEKEDRPAYPYRGRSLQRGLAEQLINQTREARTTPKVSLSIRLSCPPVLPEKEESVRSEIRSYFSVKAELADLEARVNQREGWRSMVIAAPIVTAAGLIAYPLSAYGASSFALSFLYLIILTVVWVMLWDPIEKLVFDPIFIRLRARALVKLKAASVKFWYDTPHGAGDPPPVGDGQDSHRARAMDRPAVPAPIA